MSDAMDQEPLLGGGGDRDANPSNAGGAGGASASAPAASSDGKAKSDKKAGKREMKRSPNRLMVDEAHGDGDNSCVMLSTAKMDGEYSFALADPRGKPIAGFRRGPPASALPSFPSPSFPFPSPSQPPLSVAQRSNHVFRSLSQL